MVPEQVPVPVAWGCAVRQAEMPDDDADFFVKEVLLGGAAQAQVALA